MAKAGRMQRPDQGRRAAYGVVERQADAPLAKIGRGDERTAAGIQLTAATEAETASGRRLLPPTVGSRAKRGPASAKLSAMLVTQAR
jgi:hypothetical protein